MNPALEESERVLVERIQISRAWSECAMTRWDRVKEWFSPTLRHARENDLRHQGWKDALTVCRHRDLPPPCPPNRVISRF